jgi:hypothetical protein
MTEQGASVPAERPEALEAIERNFYGPASDDKYPTLADALDAAYALGVASERARGGCVCTIDDGLVREWVQKARAVAKMKGFTVPPLPAPPASSDGGTQG